MKYISNVTTWITFIDHRKHLSHEKFFRMVINFCFWNSLGTGDGGVIGLLWIVSFDVLLGLFTLMCPIRVSLLVLRLPWYCVHGSPSHLLAQGIEPLCLLAIVLDHSWGFSATPWGLSAWWSLSRANIVKSMWTYKKYLWHKCE